MRHSPALLSLALISSSLGCETQPMRLDPARRSGQLDQASRVIECQEGDSADAGSEGALSTLYAVDAMTRKLHRFPSLAQYVGLTSVSSCEEAQSYVHAYDEYSTQNPDFEDRPDPLASSEPSAVGRAPILPHLKITNGSRDTYYDWEKGKPSPIVMIVPVYWLDNNSTKKFKAQLYDKNGALNTYTVNQFCEPVWTCTATFLDKYHLLTANHCMQNTGLRPVAKNAGYDPAHPTCPKTGQPEDPKASQNKSGYASWLILWSATSMPVGPTTEGSHPYSSEYPQTYIPMTMLGVSAYQHPYPGYHEGDNRRDLAILSIDPAQSADAYLPADISRQGGTVYLKAGGSTPTSAENDSFLIAGYGVVEGGSGVVNQLNWTKAPKDLTWKYATYDDVATGTRHDVDGHGITCLGDSGGPLYKNVAAPGKPPKLVQYAVTSFSIVSGTCPPDGTAAAYMRLEYKDNSTGKNAQLDWINLELGTGVFFKTSSGERKMVTECTPATIADSTDPKARDVYQCWGEPCGGPDQIACSSGKTCVGSRENIPAGTQCLVCPDGTCNCIVGQCMTDVSSN